MLPLLSLQGKIVSVLQHWAVGSVTYYFKIALLGGVGMAEAEV